MQSVARGRTSRVWSVRLHVWISSCLLGHVLRTLCFLYKTLRRNPVCFNQWFDNTTNILIPYRPSPHPIHSTKQGHYTPSHTAPKNPDPRVWIKIDLKYLLYWPINRLWSSSLLRLVLMDHSVSWRFWRSPNEGSTWQCPPWICGLLNDKLITSWD